MIVRKLGWLASDALAITSYAHVSIPTVIIVQGPSIGHRSIAGISCTLAGECHPETKTPDDQSKAGPDGPAIGVSWHVECRLRLHGRLVLTTPALSFFAAASVFSPFCDD